MRVLFNDGDMLKLEPVLFVRQYKTSDLNSTVEIGVASGLLSITRVTDEIEDEIVLTLYRRGYIDIREEDYGLLKPGGIV